LLEWAREKRFLETETDRINEAFVFIPLHLVWDTKIDSEGRIK